MNSLSPLVERGEVAIRAIKEEAAQHDSVTFYLAADPDREGELIARHLQKLLAGLGTLHRVSFQEITAPAVLTAVASPPQCELGPGGCRSHPHVHGSHSRLGASRIDRRYTNTSTNSMGRVQIPTLGFIVERELEREAHVPVRYFEVTAATSITDWRVRFHEKSDPDAWLDENHRFSAYRTAKAPLAETDDRRSLFLSPRAVLRILHTNTLVRGRNPLLPLLWMGDDCPRRPRPRLVCRPDSLPPGPRVG